MLKNQNQSVLRNCVNVLQFLKGFDYKETELLDRFISFIKEGENKVALQVYSMYCLVSYVQKYPELKSEFVSIIELFVTERSAAYKGGVQNFLKMTKKIV